MMFFEGLEIETRSFGDLFRGPNLASSDPLKKDLPDPEFMHIDDVMLFHEKISKT